ncbi:MAG TPA: toprim domain-containing protein [Ktedonobacteraceae bacterium]|nr:toprim domain-containing protein [Ktedonobacteraceae bacterium]
MVTIYTHRGKRIEIASEQELRSPVERGEHIRAYCHIHGSDHQRSLSITRATGWGHCFNAACGATVLVAEWNRSLARKLLAGYERRMTPVSWPTYSSSSAWPRPCPAVVQPMLLPPPRSIPQWQREEHDALCMLNEPMRQALASTLRVRRYLHERGIPLQAALAAGVGYLPSTLLNKPEVRAYRRLLRRWADRLLFPLNSPDGKGYIGRSLWHWQPGMTETAHKALLEQEAGPARWIKTYPAGWFSVAFEQLPSTVVLVEGAFDRLTLLAAGFPANAIVALAGTAAPLEWFPACVKTVVLALDGDEGGREASTRLASQLAQAGMGVRICSFTYDNRGKDWNERWRYLGSRGLTPLIELFAGTQSA